MESVGRLAGGVAHDFNNMLSIIVGYSDLALKHIQPSDKIYNDLLEIKNAGQRSADLTRQLLAFARKQTIAPRVLDLNDTIAGMLKMLGRLIGEDIILNWKPADNLWPVRLDPSQIDQVLANLAINARDAISSVGNLTIQTGNVQLSEAYCRTHGGVAPGHYVMLAVSDDGCGMDKETLEHLFEPFFTTKEIGKGTGLGLATVYGIVKQNGGFINVYSEPRHGTTFKIHLPRHEAQGAAAREMPESAEMLKGTETILLVEDEGALLELSKKMLEQLGYTVLAADSPARAIPMAEEHAGTIHLLITDVIMPEMNGRDLRHRLGLMRPGLKCLFISGYTADVISNRNILDEGAHFLQKPFSIEALAEKLREALK
jgi:CheY-like chemotaxis protein